jgi:alkylation response protein AidB-like acyl-CoA dehydrogenase
MDFNLTKEQRMIRDEVRNFAKKEIQPIAEEYDIREEFPMHLWPKMSEIGLLGLKLPEEYGGIPADNLSLAIVAEEIAKVCPGVLAGLGVHSYIATPYIDLFGTKEQKKEYIPASIKGDEIWAIAITEPNAGSDVTSISTTAVEDGNGWVINGSKMFITNGTICDHVIVVCTTEKRRGKKGKTLFIVHKDTPGFSASKKLKKLGFRASETAELIFEDCRVPKENMLGEYGMGFYHVMQGLVQERIITAAMGVGMAQACLELSLKYAKERIQFDKPIGSFQATGFKLVDMATEVNAARQLTYLAAWKDDMGQDAVTEVSMAKLYAAEAAARAAGYAVRIFGGYGFMMEYPVQRYYRDSKLLEIGAGTSEIQRGIILQRLGF